MLVEILGTLTFEMKFAESATACSLFNHLRSRRNKIREIIARAVKDISVP